MDETLNSVNAEVAEVVTPQTETTTEQVETGETEQAEVVEPQQKKPEQSQEDNAKYAAARRKAEAEAAQLNLRLLLTHKRFNHQAWKQTRFWNTEQHQGHTKLERRSITF